MRRDQLEDFTLFAIQQQWKVSDLPENLQCFSAEILLCLKKDGRTEIIKTANNDKFVSFSRSFYPFVHAYFLCVSLGVTDWRIKKDKQRRKILPFRQNLFVVKKDGELDDLIAIAV